MDVFEALADPVRRAILRRPASGQAISRHLRVLGDAGLVRAEDRGRERHYRASWEPLDEVRTFLAAVQARAPIPASALDAAAARSGFTRGVSMSPIPTGRHAVVDDWAATPSPTASPAG